MTQLPLPAVPADDDALDALAARAYRDLALAGAEYRAWRKRLERVTGRAVVLPGWALPEDVTP